MIIAVPAIVGGGLAKKAVVDTDKLEIQVPDADAGAGTKGQNAIEDALERELGASQAAEPPLDAQDAAKDGAGNADATKGEPAAKLPGEKKN